jgi:peptidylprolyl isomerase
MKPVKFHSVVLLLLVGMSSVVSAQPAPKPPVAPAPKVAPIVTTATGLKYQDLREGTGPLPQVGQTVAVNYVGTLTDGTEFDNSYKRGKPIEFPVGTGSVIKGWDEGLLSMKVGGKRQLTIPPQLGYGSRGAGGVIPPNATLVFVVELLSAK